ERPVAALVAERHRERRRDLPALVAAAGIEQRDRGATVFRKPSRHRAAARARADDDEIECVCHLCIPIPLAVVPCFDATHRRGPCILYDKNRISFAIRATLAP